MHRRDAAEVLRRVRAVAAEALHLNESGVGVGGVPHDGYHIRGPRAGVAVPRRPGRVTVRPGREERVPARTGLLEVGRGLHGGGVGLVLR